ncbi:MAG TPA: hypothetical protein VGR92_08905 [Steroidobacteraceae bacterium]|nr:hypothetical protein [Steroidobacteraceae bacterium]
MRAIVIVIGDLYLEPQLARSEAAAPGIEYLARFGDKTTLTGGWRAWVADWLGRTQYAGATPASVAAAALPDIPAGRAVWLATPLHLIAGMTGLHCDRRSILRLERAELEVLAASFRDTFRGSGFDLHPLAGGELLLSSPPQTAPPTTTEPARMLLTSVAQALPRGEGALLLRRLGAEIEMWLHGHRVNDERVRRGAPPVATLWVWGGGTPAASSPAAAQGITDAAFGSDAYVRGLWRLAGGESRPMPVDWTAVIKEPRVQRALAVVEVAELLHADSSWRLAQAVAEIDRRLISPSLAALRGGAVERLVLLANDRSLTLRAADRWRLWRRMRAVRTGYEVLV